MNGLQSLLFMSSFHRMEPSGKLEQQRKHLALSKRAFCHISTDHNDSLKKEPFNTKQLAMHVP